MRCGSTLEETTLAEISSPDLQHDAAGAAILDENFRDAALCVRISTPASRAASAMALEMAPVPPRLKPQERNAPSISPM